MSVARTIRIKGQVPGSFFRETTVRIATDLGVTGWVRNRSDGTVEILAVGDAEALDRFLGQLREAAPGSSAGDIEITPAEPTALSGFTRRSTL